MIQTLVTAAVLAAVSAPAFAQTQPVERCGILRAGGERSTYAPIEGFSVLLMPPPIRLPQRAREGARAIMCERTSIFIGPNDHRVITDTGVPLFITSGGRIAVLEIAERQLRLRFTQGEPTASERAAIGPAIERALAEMERLPPRQTTP